MAADSFVVARRPSLGAYKRCCVLRYKDGNIVFEKEDAEHGPSMSERASILRHFASSVIVLKPEAGPDGRITDSREEIQPGTLVHFQHAAYQLPLPFGRYSGGS